MAQPTLNIEQIQQAPIILPPFAMQKEFGARVAEIRVLEAEQGVEAVLIGSRRFSNQCCTEHLLGSLRQPDGGINGEVCDLCDIFSKQLYVTLSFGAARR